MVEVLDAGLFQRRAKQPNRDFYLRDGSCRHPAEAGYCRCPREPECLVVFSSSIEVLLEFKGEYRHPEWIIALLQVALPAHQQAEVSLHDDTELVKLRCKTPNIFCAS